MFGIPNFDLLTDAGKQQFVEYVVNLARKEVISYAPNFFPTLGTSGGATGVAAVTATAPTGTIVLYAGPAAPLEWLAADGSVVSQTTYADLFAICSTTYNTGGEGAGNFRLPNIASTTGIYIIKI